MPTSTLRNYSSNALPTTLNGGINNTANSISVASMPGTWPAAPFEAAIERGTQNEEAWLVSAVSGTGPFTWTVTRGYDGTQAIGHNSGVTIEHTTTGVDPREANAHASDASASDAHGPIAYADLNTDLLRRITSYFRSFFMMGT